MKNSIAATASEPAGCVSPVIAAGTRVLRECAVFVRTLPPASYREPSNVLPGGTIGKHVRHTLDHFAAVVRSSDVIDYDHRERDVPMEVDPRPALAEIDRLIEELGALDAGRLERRVRVRVLCSAEGAEAEAESTIARELAFASHHAVHHQAMMRAIAGELGGTTPVGFGVAPATKRHAAASGAEKPVER